MIVNELKHRHRIALLLQACSLPRSTFYYHQKGQGCSRDGELEKEIAAIYHEHKGRYGYRRITLELRKKSVINHKKVQRLMQLQGLKSTVRPKKYRSYRGQVGHIAENYLKRDFVASKPNTKWVTDVTEFNVSGEKLYLSPILDLFNQEVIAYQLSRRPCYQMINQMLTEAFLRLGSDEKVLLHSDQGWQYQMRRYRNHLKEQNVTQSMSRKGNCLDNAVMENFFGILKTECFHNRKFKNLNELERELHDYINYYNHKRIKLKLKGLSPVEYRTQSLLN